MGKIIDRVRERQDSLSEKDMSRRTMEADAAIMQSLLGAYGGRHSVAGPIICLVLVVGFFAFCLYAIFWR